METKQLGRKVTLPEKPSIDILDSFENPGATEVIFKTNEFTSLCPVTGQPDWATITIVYRPRERCVESKSLKLYLQSFRNEKAFMEKLCSIIFYDLADFLAPRYLNVSVNAVPRGGLALEAKKEETWSN